MWVSVKITFPQTDIAPKSRGLEDEFPRWGPENLLPGAELFLFQGVKNDLTNPGDFHKGQAPEPWGLTAIVDPAGLRFVHALGPAGAGGATVSPEVGGGLSCHSGAGS